MTPIRDSHAAGDTAMTEIALALAMAFFAILVLALVSMGGRGPEAAALVTAALAPPADPARADAAQPLAAEDLLLVRHAGIFYDADLTPLDEAALAARMAGTAGRIVLAIDPAAPLSEAMDARATLGGSDAVVTVLTPDWIARLSAQD